MSIEKHDLIHELPEFREKIHELKISDRHFAKLFEKYHEVDHEVHHFESGAEHCSDTHLENQKKTRLNLKDQLLAILKSTG